MLLAEVPGRISTAIRPHLPVSVCINGTAKLQVVKAREDLVPLLPAPLQQASEV